MKRLILISLSSFNSILLFAQDRTKGLSDPNYNKAILDKFIEIPTIILLIYLAVHLFLRILRMILDNGLKKAMIEKGISDEAMKQLLQHNPNELLNETVRWCLLFAGAALGIFLASFFPQGLISLALIATGISIGFLMHYLLLRNKQ